MKIVQTIINSLEDTPLLLNNLLVEIPEDMYRIKRLPGKWCIQEQVCHLVEAQKILIERFKIFEKEENPIIKDYIPTRTNDPDKYFKMDMDESLKRFPVIREDMVNMLRKHPSSFWKKKGKHDSFEPYSTRILLMHCLNIDYAHLFSIEQLGLTKPGLETEIMVLP